VELSQQKKIHNLHAFGDKHRRGGVNKNCMINQSNTIRTLIVDDSEDECILLRLELRHIASIKLIGFVHDGTEAVAYLSGTERFRNREMFPYPDLMLLDYRMPRCSGMEVLAKLQHHFHRPRIVLWSDTIEQIDVPLALRLGANVVCRKAANRMELLKVINRVQKGFCKSPVFNDAQLAEALMPA
jgi:CheY-like chemotaxis protein